MKPGSHSLIPSFLVFLAGLLLLAIAALFLIERTVFLPVLLDGERDLAERELSRITNALGQSQNALIAQTRDWAHWDDTHAFVQGNDDNYTSTNFSREMFEDLQDQAMIYFSPDRQPLWIAGIDPDTDAYTTCTSAADDCRWAAPFVDVLRPFLRNVPPSGLGLNLALPWPALAGIAPILRTDRSGPAHGWLVKLKLIDERLSGLIDEQTGLPVTISAQSPGHTPEKGITLIREPDQLLTSTPLTTHTEGPSLQLSTVIPRQRFQTAARIFRYSLAWTAVLLVVVMAVVVALLAFIVLKPLNQLTRFTSGQQRVNAMLEGKTDGDVPLTLLKRQDEFGNLARHFQRLLDHQRNQAAMLLELSQHDPLTGLANRRLFDARLNAELIDVSKGPTSVLMIDIDHFKRYNDHYGHPEGDACLIKVSEAMEQSLFRPGYLVARTGGEEFSALLPDTTAEEATEHAETLRQAIIDLAIPHEDSPVLKVVSVSIGVAVCEGPRRRSGSALMRNADQALYKAKEGGRNRVAMFGQDVSDEKN